MVKGKDFEYGGMKFYAKKNCKSCRYSPGFVTRTFPRSDGLKGMYVQKTLCHCVTEVKVPDANESVVPKVSEEAINYASQAVPTNL